MSQPILCPNCKHPIELTEALAKPLIDAARADFERATRSKEDDIARRESALAVQARSLEESRVSLEKQVEARVREQVQAAEANAKKQAQQQLGDELRRARDDAAAKDSMLAERDRKLADAAKAELELRRERQELREAKEQFELSMQRALDEERGKVRDAALRDAQEQYRLKAAEKDKLIADMQRKVEELQRKADQGSQQLQGEVQELDLESLLRARFPRDHIEPVPKGQFGGDVLQRVVNDSGQVCGSILWESKRTRKWENEWLSKLRDNQRTARAEVSAILSSVLPKGVESFEHVEGVWVTGYKALVPMTIALRQTLLEVAAARRAGEGVQSKAEMLYQYMTGPRFKQRIAAIIEAFSLMQEDLDKERKAVTKLWAKRQEQIDRVMQSTVGMYGDLQGIAGRSLPEIEGLDFPMLDAPKT